MNTSALKAFAPAVRKQLMQAVSIKLDFALSATTPDYLATYASQVRVLRELAAADRKGLVERVSYTWFNRLTALRYLDARNWHPFPARVLMAASAEDTLPELFTMARTGAVPEELRPYVDVVRMEAILQGRIPSADPQGEAYRMLVLAACRFYHALLPEVFERLDDETELLLPDDLLTQQSVAQGFRTEITDEDCEQVEVLGWLYQFYISEKKDEVMKRKAAVPAEDIPAVTQLFTPHWIVRYLVENSLGRLWLLNRPESLLKAWMPYYIESTEPETEFLRIARPQDIRLCDPAVGSGHMLTYAFDLLYVIYEEEGYAPSEIPALILRHNLTGVEIDARAAQLAALALTLKGREKSQRFFQQQHFVRPNIVELRDIHFAEGELLGYSEALMLGGLFTAPILRLMHQFEEAKNFGSLIQPCVGEADIAFARGSVEARDLGSNLFLNETHKKVLRVLEQADALVPRYQIIVANPPYMGSIQMNRALTSLIAAKFPAGSQDLYSTFIIRNLQSVVTGGLVAMITFQNWLSASSFTPLREFLVSQCSILSLVHNGRGVWGPDFGTCAFIITRGGDSVGWFYKLFDQLSHVATNEYLDARFRQTLRTPTAVIATTEFASLPSSAIVYWASERVRQLFRTSPNLGSVVSFKAGMSTGDNTVFQRYWFEVSRKKFTKPNEGPAIAGTRWFPCNSGGDFRKWYGNDMVVVDWEDTGSRIKAHAGSAVRNEAYYFREALTYNKISIGRFGARFRGCGYVFDDTGRCVFPLIAAAPLHCVLGFLSSTVADHFLRMLTPTVSFTSKELAAVPWMGADVEGITPMVEECIDISRCDWDDFETSWDFEDHPLVRSRLGGTSLGDNWHQWQGHKNSSVRRLQDLETTINRLFIESYSLGDELVPEVPDDQITIARADLRRDMASFISFAVGCVMGRYSLDRPGLILADPGDAFPEYFAKVRRAAHELTFTPDKDGVVPVLDDEWFQDDVVARTREFMKVTFGEATLRENIRFIEESLGRDLRTYFLTDFYKDHVQTYKKRPIYWMVQSPRKGFRVLIYLHRYTRDTMNVILNRYLREFQVKLRSKIDHLATVQTSASTTVREKTVARKESDKLNRTLHECQEWERQTILPLAQARIELDLDDGVRVNYLKLGEALAPIPGLAAAEE